MKRLFIFLMVLPLLASCGENKQVSIVKPKQQPLQHKIVQKHAVQAVHRKTSKNNWSELRQHQNHPNRYAHGHGGDIAHQHGHRNETIVVVAPNQHARMSEPNVHLHPSNANAHIHVHSDREMDAHQHGHNDSPGVIVHGHD